MRVRTLPRPAVSVGAAVLAAGCLVGGALPALADAPGAARAAGAVAAASVPMAASAPAAARWVPMARSGLPKLGAVTGAWDGRELLVVGADTDGNTRVRPYAAAWSPARNAWRRLAPPLADEPLPMTGLASVWTGRELFVWGQVRQAYDPATNRWRRVPQPPSPFGADDFVLAWTGRYVIGWGGGCCAASRNTGSAYDPRTGRWTALPASPLAPRDTTGVWTGRELFVVGGREHDGSVFYRDVAAYDPGRRTWRKLPPLPAPRAGAAVVWTGREVLVIGGDARASDGRAVPGLPALAYSPLTNRWRPVPSPRPAAGPLTAVWTGRQVLVWSEAEGSRPGSGLVYSPASARWSALPPSGLSARLGSVVAWTGRDLVIWGGSRVTDGARFRPASS